MSALHDPSRRPTDEAAMAIVLAAERDARAALEESERRAAAHLDAAHVHAKAIAAAAARRGAAVRAAMETRLAARLGALEALERQARAESEPDRDDHLRLERALVRHARELTGGEP